MSRNRLFHTGNAVVAIVARVWELPERGSEVFAAGRGKVCAGGGFNSAAAAARQRMEVLYAGAHGRGAFGDVVRAGMVAEGIEVWHQPVTSADSGLSLVMVEPGGERTFVSVVGAETTWATDQVSGFDLRRGDTVYVSGYSLLHPSSAGILGDWVPTIEAGVRVVLDLCPLIGTAGAPVVDPVLGRADWICAHLDEATELTEAADHAGAASALAGRARSGAVVRQGAAGCWVAERGGEAELVPGFSVKAVDVTGAGD
ncbi:MAG: PfkB family carbohydrate kinase, partial [Micrococcales bacterium]|nr:PfkB family carbohydrate kinase [Micrococcales bacterium]